MLCLVLGQQTNDVTRLVSIVVINLTLGMYNYIHKSYKEYNVSLYMCRLITVYIG